MTQLIKVFLVFLILTGAVVVADTAADLKNRFRARIGETDTSVTFITNDDIYMFLDMAQDKVVRFGKFLPKKTTITYSDDSTKYDLPVSLKEVTKILILIEGLQWEPVFLNPGFAQDSDEPQYDVLHRTPDTTEIRFRGRNFYEDMTVVIEYMGDAADFYDGITADSTVVCEVQKNRQVFIVEEAIGYYEQSKRSFQTAAMMWQLVRTDLGVLTNEPVKE